MSDFIKITEENQELYHFGIMGMRWGKRTGGNAQQPTRDIRRSNKNIAKYQSKIDSEKKYQKDSARENAEIAKYHNKDKQWVDKQNQGRDIQKSNKNIAKYQSKIDSENKYQKDSARENAEIAKYKQEKKERKQSTPYRKTKIGAAVVGGILAGNLAASAASNITLNKNKLAAVSIATGVLSGKKMYDLMTEQKNNQ